jgi:hypothetical protein
MLNFSPNKGILNNRIPNNRWYSYNHLLIVAKGHFWVHFCSFCAIAKEHQTVIYDEQKFIR